MSSQKGNSTRTRPQKYKNSSAFRNNLHDTSHRTKQINSTQVTGVCEHCKGVIEWKIKYKKYKPLSQPKTCVKCEQRTVKHAYHVMCEDCGKKLQVCTKCCKANDTITSSPNDKELLQLDGEMKIVLQSLPERKRRTFIRYMTKISKTEGENDKDNAKEILIAKLNSLKVNDEDNESDLDFSDTENSD